MKEQTKRFFVRKGCEIARKEREVYEWWLKRLEYLEELREWGEDVGCDLVEARRKLRVFMERRGREIMSQARMVVKEKDEKCTSFFFKKVYGGKVELSSVLDEGESGGRSL